VLENHAAMLEKQEASKLPMARFEDHSQDHGLVHSGLISTAEVHNVSALSLRQPVSQVALESTGASGLLVATFQKRSEHGEAHYASVPIPQSQMADSMLANHSEDHALAVNRLYALANNASGLHHPMVDAMPKTHVMARLENHSEDFEFAHIVAPKKGASKKLDRTGTRTKSVSEDHSGSPNVQILEHLEMQIRALDFHEHRPSAASIVAAHQSGLMYNAWLVSRAGFGVVVGMAVAFMWLLQCSRVFTRSVATPIRENFDQHVLADVYKAAKCSKVCTRSGVRATPSPKARHEQRILADVYKAAQSRPRVHTQGLAETVAESSRVLRWVASKRSKKAASHGDDAGDHCKPEDAAKRWYDQ